MEKLNKMKRIKDMRGKIILNFPLFIKYPKITKLEKNKKISKK
jgi:hypothetical protein